MYNDWDEIERCEQCGGLFDPDEMTYGLCPECRDVLEDDLDLDDV